MLALRCGSNLLAAGKRAAISPQPLPPATKSTKSRHAEVSPTRQLFNRIMKNAPKQVRRRETPINVD
jgi:hypothetical protein